MFNDFSFAISFIGLFDFSSQLEKWNGKMKHWHATCLIYTHALLFFSLKYINRHTWIQLYKQTSTSCKAVAAIYMYIIYCSLYTGIDNLIFFIIKLNVCRECEATRWGQHWLKSCRCIGEFEFYGVQIEEMFICRQSAMPFVYIKTSYETYMLISK